MSDAAVSSRTGRTWSGWFELLDAAGAAKMEHPEIARSLENEHGLSGWWSQTVTVEYERAIGRRQKYQRPDGFSVSVSRTYPVAIERLYHAWTDDGFRRNWLTERVLVRNTTPHKSLRLTWADGDTPVDVYLYDKGGAKSQVSLQHRRLPEQRQVEEMRAVWKGAFERLSRALTSN